MDEDDLFNFLKNIGLGKKEEDEIIEDEEEEGRMDNLDDDLLDSMDFIGRSLKEIAPSLRKKTKELASKLIFKYAQGSFHGVNPLPTYTSHPINEQNTIFDIDMERTIDSIIENPLEDHEIYTYKRDSTSNPVILLLDTSYSMSGVKLIMAGLTVGILAQLVPAQDLCVLGFHKDIYYIKRFQEELSPYNLINRIMSIVPRGGTNLSSALERGNSLLNKDVFNSKLLLLSDAEPTTGANPIVTSSKLARLDVLLFPDGNKWLANRIVSEVFKGQLFTLRKINDVPEALKKIFTGWNK